MLHHLCSTVLLTLIPTTSDPASQRGKTSLLRLIPANADVVATTADLDQIRGELATNRWWKLAHDPAFDECWQELGMLDGKAAEELEGVRPLDVLASVHG